jgi:hypothetical protein
MTGLNRSNRSNRTGGSAAFQAIAEPKKGGAELAAWVAKLGAHHSCDAAPAPELADEILQRSGVSDVVDVSERTIKALQENAERAGPGVANVVGVSNEKVGRMLRRSARHGRHLAKAVAKVIEKGREEGSDPNWKPEAFPALDYKIRAETWSVMRDPSGIRARITCAALPPAQADVLNEEAKRIAAELKVADGYRTVRWRELVAGAWASWRLKRPIRAPKTKKGKPRAQLGDEALGLVPPPLGDPAEPVKRRNPWAGGFVVDGYAREAFCLLMQDIRTGECMSISKLFYTNGSGVLGVFGYLAAPVEEDDRRRRHKLNGVLGLYTRKQPPAWSSKFVGPPKKGKDGRPLLDADGNPQRYALSEHWYHRSMCGRRTAAGADRGGALATRVMRELCPWLFEEDKTAKQLLEGLAQREASMEGGQPPSPAPESEPAAETSTTAPPD